MSVWKHPQHPDIAEDMWKSIDDIIDAEKNNPGSLIAVLRKSQGVVGYLPVELLDYIGKGLNVPCGDVYGVATFYSFFSLQPKGRHTIKVCMGTACYVKGIKEVKDRIKSTFQVTEGGTSPDRRFSLEAVRCIGACGLAPVMAVDDNTHGDIASDSVIDILERYE